MHTLFAREHNRLAEELALAYPLWGDEQLYQVGRKLVYAQIQKITFNDFLPILLGSVALDPYSGYDPSANPRCPPIPA